MCFANILSQSMFVLVFFFHSFNSVFHRPEVFKNQDILRNNLAFWLLLEMHLVTLGPMPAGLKSLAAASVDSQHSPQFSRTASLPLHSAALPAWPPEIYAWDDSALEKAPPSSPFYSGFHVGVP